MDYFALAVFGFAGGVLARSLIPFGWAAVAFCIVIALLFLGVYAGSKQKRYVAAGLCIIALSLGAARTILAPQTIPEPLVPFIGTKVSWEGTVVADPDVRDTNQHLVVSVTQSAVETKILAFAPTYPEFSYGEHVRVSGMLEKPAPFATDGGRTFAYDTFLAKDGIFAIVPQAYVDETAPPSGVRAKIMGALYGAKHTFVRGLENALPEPSAALAEGLLTGGKQGLGKGLIDAFTIAGLLQIVVLSGYNVMVVAEGILRGLSFIPKRYGLAVAGAGIVGFVLAAGAGSSAVRAGLMACLALFARASNRTYAALRGLLFVLLLMLIWNPLYLAFDPGFDLSFVATIGLILGTPLIAPRLVWIKNAFLRDIVATTLAAQVAVLPLLLYQTGNLSLVALPANLLVMPVVPLAMALAFIAGLTGVVLPIIAPVFGMPAHLVLSYIVYVGIYAAQLPFAHIVLPAFPFVLVVIAYCAMALSNRDSHTLQLRLSKKASM